MVNQTDYLAVATEWQRRGFFTTPVKPMAKHPRFNDFNKHPAKNLSVATQNAYDYPHDDVGLVSTRGEGHVFWLDIDHESVEDRIVRDTGRRLPRTLTTSSRPKTAPWKKHLCFRQTSFSVAEWRTEMSGIRDFTLPKGEDGKIPNLFDVKGCGGGGFVVAAGCCRQVEFPKESGLFVDEQYTVTDDAPVVDVPDWLVTWVAQQWHQFLSDNAVRRATDADFAQTMRAALTKAETERRVTEFEYDPTKDFLSIDAKGGALVPKEYRNGFLKSLGGELATRGIPKPLTERMLQIATEVCETYTDGEDERDKAVQSVINRLRIGNLWIGRKQIRDAESSVSLDMSLVNPSDLSSVLRHAAQGLPWSSGELSSHFVNERLWAAAKDTNCNERTDDNWKQRVSRTLRGIGAKSRKSRSPSGRLVWVWTLETQPREQEQEKHDSNVVTCHWSNKELSAFKHAPPDTELLHGTQESL